MKIENVKAGMIVVYKGNDPQENVVPTGAMLKVLWVKPGLIHQVGVEVIETKHQTVFNATYLKKTDSDDQNKENTVAGFQAPSGQINKRSALASRLIILPSSSRHTDHANVLANRFANEDISAKELLAEWRVFAVAGGDITPTIFINNTKSILDYILENEK